MPWAKKHVLNFFDRQFRLAETFWTGSASRKTQSKKVESKKLFFDCARKPDV